MVHDRALPPGGRAGAPRDRPRPPHAGNRRGPRDDLAALQRQAGNRAVAGIAARPPLAVQKIKEGLRRAVDPDWKELGVWVSTSLTELFQTEDHREGVKSFLEKRPAVYVGR